MPTTFITSLLGILPRLTPDDVLDEVVRHRDAPEHAIVARRVGGVSA